MSAIRILGIDPGLNTTGYGVIEIQGPLIKLCEAGIVRSRAKQSIEKRLLEIHSGVKEVIAAFEPQRMALEQLFSHYSRPRTAILMGHARGVICLAAGEAGIPVAHYEPTRVKKVLTGNGHAPKHQMQQAVKLQLSLATFPEPADVADALAIALCSHHIGDNTPLEELLENR
ncbi:crossover junction endodeoxyribonuclease RuvC [Novipirellula artificiosorum]|uniref:Crossover junction endodeoxyribonuclease RuvC n=1 Tax=Novipirellula artificiosorum TaxID=2528016 RepID=A0A5C6E463_9BACT|nr:crossover junction endodeoxyribonuclease RuvC [Novipirellula artificiosorum]TWU42009.1 Crossover junction endodeoxyribonuclease RuvC [Novipirellula artificiosorum]